MSDPHELDRCPHCSHDDYTFDGVSKRWCCGRCYTMETTDKREQRQAREVMQAVNSDEGAGEPMVEPVAIPARRSRSRSGMLRTPHLRNGTAAISTRPRSTALSPPRPHFH